MFIVLYLLLGCVIWSTSEDIGGYRPDYCDKGYYGVFCKNECHFPFYGKWCDGICQCDAKFCNFKDGCQAADRCFDGYTGPYCTENCTYPHYGQACQKRCLCPETRCSFVSGCNNVNSEVKMKTELNTDSLIVTSVTSREHSKTTRFSSQTHTTADRNEGKLKGTDCINITSDPFEAKEGTNSTIHLSDTTMANNVLPTSMVNTEHDAGVVKVQYIGERPDSTTNYNKAGCIDPGTVLNCIRCELDKRGEGMLACRKRCGAVGRMVEALWAVGKRV
uniref:Uncharacterized protein LOC111103622 n=1 Tax=Crassostrea virginica TaxID=6565 RepID=A0A8B8ANV7_CRAVI|nr:uncharacterized protein LOC111103622 [Crassostrea virginica]